MKGRSEGLPKNCFREPGASYGMMTAANCAAVHQLEGKAASGEVDRDIGTRDHMRPRQSGCRTNSRFLKWFWRRAAEKDGGGACPQQMGAPSCSVQNAIGLLPNIMLTGRSFSCS